MSRTHLRSDEVFMLDDGFEVLVWVGMVRLSLFASVSYVE